MTAERALIIAVQKSRIKHLMASRPKKLKTARLDAAKRFREWLEEKWEAEHLTGSILFCWEPRLPGHLGASSNDIIDALKKVGSPRPQYDR